MEKVRFGDAPIYSAPGHQEIVARRLQGGEASSAEFVLVGHSSFSTGAEVPMDVAPIGKIYVVVEGCLTIVEAGGQRHDLNAMDSIFVPPNEARAVINTGEVPAAMIVITPPPAR